MAPRLKVRAREAQLAFEALTIEGGLLSPEWLSKIAQLQAAHQAEADYRIPKGLALRDEIGRFWRIAQAHWSDFRAGREKQAEAVALADRFILGLLRDSFGFGSIAKAEPVELGDRTYPIGHLALEGRVPVVIAPAASGLDALSPVFGEDGRRRSAFGLAQELLNADDRALWGLATDGLTLRLCRDNVSLTRPAWIEADLGRIFAEERYADFAVLWLLIHESRFGAPGQPVTDCPLEVWRSAGREEGTRAREKLREGVEDALVALGRGFLSHPDNQALRAALHGGELTRDAYFQQLLRLVYRVIFLLTAEERAVLHPPDAAVGAKDLYEKGYSLRRLRDRSAKRSAHDRFGDLWEGLKITFRGVATGEPRLALPALGGLFAKDQCPDLDGAKLENRWLMVAIFKLAWVREESGLARVNWRDMGPEELGSVYESLLELVPLIPQDGRGFSFATGDETKGNARKTTGSYYTPDGLVQVLLDSALEPVIQATVAAHPEDPAEALLKLAVLDPACGSGHFLLAAARRLAVHVARHQANGTPSAEQYRHAVRQVVSRSLFGVDLNPMAVELCRVSLWMEAVEPGRPLSFLDSHIQRGNALLGATPELMKKGVPDAAFEPIEGDDKKTASLLKKRNKEVSEKQGLFDTLWSKDTGSETDEVTRAVAALDAAPDADLAAVAGKEARWEELQDSDAFRHQKFVADAWCAAFLWPKPELESASGGKQKKASPIVEAAPTNALWLQIQSRNGQAPALTVKTVEELAAQYHFFHWHLAFPQIFARGGFDVVLGNPPWDQVQFRDQEYFASSAPSIGAARTATARDVEVESLQATDPTAFTAYERAKRGVAGSGHFLRNSGAYPLTGSRRLNLYSLFGESAERRRNTDGFVGMVLPSGIVTDENSVGFFEALVERGTLRSVYELNNKGFFPDAGSGHVNRFALFVLGPKSGPMRFLFRGSSLAELADPDRVVQLEKADFRLLNPNVPTCPVLLSARDARVLRELYRTANVLLREGVPDGNPWGLATVSAFNMSDDSDLFRKHGQRESLLPLYEAKMFSLFDHRFGDYAALTPGEESHILPRPDESQHADPGFSVASRHWISEAAVRERMRGHRWAIAWRDITNDANARTCVVAVLGDVAIARNNSPGLYPKIESAEVLLLVACLSSFLVDFACRKKLGGTHLTRTMMHQLPVHAPAVFKRTCDWCPEVTIGSWCSRRVLELTYTAWDLLHFAKDIGYEGPPLRWDQDRRFLLRAELDAAFFHLYGISRQDSDYILDTFPIVRKNDEKAHGEYRTKRVILEIYDGMAEAIRTGKAYQTRLDPPPADPRVAHPAKRAG
jgi:hypothetical protein